MLLVCGATHTVLFQGLRGAAGVTVNQPYFYASPARMRLPAFCCIAATPLPHASPPRMRMHRARSTAIFSRRCATTTSSRFNVRYWALTFESEVYQQPELCTQCTVYKTSFAPQTTIWRSATGRHACACMHAPQSHALDACAQLIICRRASLRAHALRAACCCARRLPRSPLLCVETSANRMQPPCAVRGAILWRRELHAGRQGTACSPPGCIARAGRCCDEC